MDFVLERYIKNKYIGDNTKIKNLGDGTLSGALIASVPEKINYAKWNTLTPAQKKSKDYIVEDWPETTTVAELSSNLVNSNGDTFIYDYQNGKYGFNTDPNRGADTFHPFKSGFTIPWIGSVPSIQSPTYYNVDSFSTLKLDDVYTYDAGNNSQVHVYASLEEITISDSSNNAQVSSLANVVEIYVKTGATATHDYNVNLDISAYKTLYFTVTRGGITWDSAYIKGAHFS